MWREDLQCTVVSLDHNFATHTGTLAMTDGACCDMMGCINLFLSIDKDVRDIKTLSGAVSDTRYVKRDNRWEAHR